MAHIALEPRDRGRLKVTVDHRGLDRYEDVERWKFYWAEWLEALDGSGPQPS